MGASNINLLMGNHEQMMLDALTSEFDRDGLLMALWLGNGGTEVLSAFRKLPKDEQLAILDYTGSLPYNRRRWR